MLQGRIKCRLDGARLERNALQQELQSEKKRQESARRGRKRCLDRLVELRMTLHENVVEQNIAAKRPPTKRPKLKIEGLVERPTRQIVCPDGKVINVHFTRYLDEGILLLTCPTCHDPIYDRRKGLQASRPCGRPGNLDVIFPLPVLQLGLLPGAPPFAFCTMSKLPLQNDVVACQLGFLYNRYVVREFLTFHPSLRRKWFQDKSKWPQDFDHIIKMQDMITVRPYYVEDWEAKGLPIPERWTCPLTGITVGTKGEEFCVCLKKNTAIYCTKAFDGKLDEGMIQLNPPPDILRKQLKNAKKTHAKREAFVAEKVMEAEELFSNFCERKRLQQEKIAKKHVPLFLSDLDIMRSKRSIKEARQTAEERFYKTINLR